MPDTQTYVLDGKRYTVPAGTSMDELEEFIQSQGARQSTPAEQQAHTASLKPLQTASREQVAGLDPQERYLANLPENQREAARQKLESGMSMTIPEAVMTAGTMAPIGAIERLGVKGAAAALGKTALRGAAGTVAGEEAGRYVGRPVGRMLGNEQAGEQIGSVAGALAGGTAALKNPAYMSRLPLGAGRLLMSEESYADAIAARKVAQKGADIRAGLRKPPVEALAEPPTRLVKPNEPGTPRVGNEGSAARWTNERVMQLAKQGNREAIMTAERRGMKLPENARYVMGDPNYAAVTYNPRDVTTFTPEGIPIKQGGKKLSVITEEAPSKMSVSEQLKQNPSMLNRAIDKAKGMAYEAVNPNPEWTHEFKESASRITGSPHGDLIGNLRGRGLDIPAGMGVTHDLAAELEQIGKEVPGKFTANQRRIIEPILKKSFESEADLTDAVTEVRRKLGLPETPETK